MYCKHCGNKLNEKSIFCDKCGKTIKETIKKVENTKSKKFDFVAFFWAIGILGFIISMLLILNYFDMNSNSNKGNSTNSTIENNDKSQLLNRKANNNDIEIENDEKLSLSINIILMPKSDIQNLQLTFQFYDKNDILLDTKTKIVGNVLKNKQYTITFSLSEFSFSSILYIHHYTCGVSGGTVSYFN